MDSRADLWDCNVSWVMHAQPMPHFLAGRICHIGIDTKTPSAKRKPRDRSNDLRFYVSGRHQLCKSGLNEDTVPRPGRAGIQGAERKQAQFRDVSQWRSFSIWGALSMRAGGFHNRGRGVLPRGGDDQISLQSVFGRRIRVPAGRKRTEECIEHQQAP